MKLKFGPDEGLEEKATQLLVDDRREQVVEGWHHNEINDWFTEDQMYLRVSREVQTSLGFPGEYPGFRGQYSRAYNPEINKRPGPKHLYRPGMDPWRQQMWEEVDDWSYHPGQMCYPRPEKVSWF